MFTDKFGVKITLGILLSVLAVVFGCAKESVAPSKPVVVNLKDGGDCLTAFGENITKYRKGELSDGQVRGFWACVQKAVADYQRLTSGDQSGGAYTPQALRRFLRKYFLKSQDIGDPLLASIMEVKRVVLAGSARSIQRDELSRLRSFLEMLKEVSLDMNPHVRFIFMGADVATDEEIRSAGASAERALARLGGWLEGSGQPYSFDQLAGLIANLRDFANEDGQTSGFFAHWEQALEILPYAKQILFSGPRGSIAGDQWGAVSASLGQGLHAFLAVKYAFRDDLNTALTRAAVPAGMSFAVRILERGAAAHGKRGIPLAEWRALFLELEKTKWLPDAFSADSLDFALQWILNRTLSRGHEPPAKAVTMAHLKTMDHVLSDWRMLLEAVTGKGPYEGLAGERFLKMTATNLPHEWDERGRIAFRHQPASTWTTDGLRHMIWPFVVMSWLKDAYVNTKQLEVDGDTMEKAGLEILTTMRKFGWLTETKDTIGRKLLRESDLFTLASNGNGTVDLFEATHYLAFIASGFRAAQIWLTEAENGAVCGGRHAECVRRAGGDLSRDILASMPHLQNWLSQKDSVRRFVAYMKSGEETVLEKVTDGDFKTADLLQVWMLFQYVETFLQRYDRDFSDRISLPESAPAFKVYGPILGTMLSRVGLPPDELFGFFTFMMKYGDTPFTMLGGQLLYNHWKWHQNNWAFESERTHLMGILNQLSKL